MLFLTEMKGRKEEIIRREEVEDRKKKLFDPDVMKKIAVWDTNMLVQGFHLQRAKKKKEEREEEEKE